MKSKLLKDISHFLGVLMAVVLVMTYPSMSGIISEPSYKGSVPSDFTITSITLNG